MAPLHFPWNETLFSSTLCQGISPFLSLVAAASDTVTSLVSFLSVSDPDGYNSCCLCHRRGHVSSASGLATAVSLASLLPLPSQPSFLELVRTHTHTSTRNHHQAVHLIAGRVWDAYAPRLPKHSLATSSPVTRLLEILILGKLLIQGLVPGAVLQSFNKHTRAAFLSLEGRHSLMREVNISHLAAKDQEACLSSTVFSPSLSSFLSCFSTEALYIASQFRSWCFGALLAQCDRS